MSERMARAQLLLMETRRLQSEARTAGPERVEAIIAELKVLRDSAYDIRREQLLEEINPPKRKRWWRRASNTGQSPEVES